MDQHASYTRPPKRRKPLVEVDSRANANNLPLPNANAKAATSPSRVLPHNESFFPDGTLAVHGGIDSPQSPENKRLSALSKEGQPDSKRSSAISTASTNASGTTQRRKVNIGPWHLGQTIGKGGGSRVRLVRHFHTGQKAAAKIISKQFAEKARAVSMANLVEQARHDPTWGDGKVMPFGLEREIVIMKLLNHKNIVRLYDVWENRNELYLIMEYVEGGELFDYIQRGDTLDERYVVYLFRQIVAALLYCHRIRIHHRDLKPENILIDRHTAEVKLVDFGMAALQPEGRYLSTPCGSPHYAAPELLSMKQYEGSMVDVWSCGVILYVMLTTIPPFNFPADPKGTLSDDEKMHSLFRKIRKADYIMPKTLSIEAQDLLRRIFQPNPKFRIDMEAIWNHPFLHKYDQQLKLEPRLACIIGPRPKLETWTLLRPQDVDREILRNMRTLWHSDHQDVLIEKLTNEDGNHEKYFYSVLLKYREEYLENYTGDPFIGYSTSDHQHMKMPDPRDAPPLPGVERSKSQYSIMNNEHLHSMHSLYEPPPSDASYDPFRASRDPVVKASKQYMTIKMHRGASSASSALHPSSTTHAQRSSLRVKALKRGSQRSSHISHSSTSLKGSSAHRLSATRQSMSRSSLGSSNWASSPPVGVVKPNTLHRRAVNFSHVRRSSTSSALTVRSRNNSQIFEGTPEKSSMRKQPLSRTSGNLTALPSSPATKPPNAVRSRKENVPGAAAQLRIRKAKDPGHIVDREARKVSAELEKVCQEAFYRSSVGSSNRTSATDKQIGYLDTPPSSVSPHSPMKINTALALDRKGISDRPLPPLPVSAETPKTFTARELVETRNRIAARYAEANGDNADYFRDVLAHLDTLTASMQSDPRRAASAPQAAAKAMDELGYLPVISEEGRFADAEEHIHETNTPKNWTSHRAITEPVALKGGGQRQERAQETIRLVDASSPTPIAPLNIRKVSGASTVTKSTVTRSNNTQDGTVRRRDRTDGVHDFAIYEDPDVDFASSPGQAIIPTITTTVPVSSTLVNEDPPKSKRRGWFRRITSDSKEPDYIDRPDSPAGNNPMMVKKAKQKSPTQWEDLGLDDRVKPVPMPPLSQIGRASVGATSQGSEFPMRGTGSDKLESPSPKGEESVRRGLWKLFQRGNKKSKEKEKPMDRGLRLGSPADFSSSSLGYAYDISPNSLVSGTPTRSMPVDSQQSNWLARFLGIKPANRVVCFQFGRGRVRQELVRILRDWKRFGVRDVTFDRTTNVVNCRVDKANKLKIKPVSLIAELFVVLEHGRRAQLTLVRFTQTRGAASSFRRVVEVIEDVMDAKGMLVEDEAQKVAMSAILS